MIQLVHKTLVATLLVFTISFFSNTALAQVNVTGTWTGRSFAGGSYYQNDFAFAQSGTKVTGSGLANQSPGVVTGTIVGNQFTFFSNYPKLGYSSSATAITDGRTMSGTFLDSQGTRGTFTLTNLDPVLTPKLVLANPPVVQLKNKTATFTCAKFSGIQSAATARASLKSARPDAASAKTTIRYEVTLKQGRTRQTILSARNRITVTNLKTGAYSVSYRGQAIKNAKPIFSSKASPAAVFTVK